MEVRALSGRSNSTAPRRRSAQDSREVEALLMERIRAKDVDAFEELYRSYRNRLARFLFKLVHRPQMVEEVLDDTLMVVWDRAHAFNGESKLSTWIFAIAYRKAMKALRSHDDPIEDKAAEERVSLEPSPEDAFGRERTRALLMQAMAELSPEHRAVVEFTYFHEMGYQEIAEIMSCPVGTVKTRMFHARRQLRRRLAGELPDWI
jgi:RNA polymerase sigma-70 factor (ECF subfamily)